jgi:hypothetical protein
LTTAVVSYRDLFVIESSIHEVESSYYGRKPIAAISQISKEKQSVQHKADYCRYLKYASRKAVGAAQCLLQSLFQKLVTNSAVSAKGLLQSLFHKAKETYPINYPST